MEKDQARQARIQAENGRILTLLGRYLTGNAAFLNGEMVDAMRALGMSETEAVSLLLSSAMGLDVEADMDDRALYHAYFPHMVHVLDPATVRDDPYYRMIEFPAVRQGAWTFQMDAYRPYEVFVMDDFLVLEDGRQIPQIGCFPEAFAYPAVYEDGRLWMSVTPNEINTAKAAVSAASGRVLMLGLGLGYFAFLASQKPEVTQITVVERSRDVIRLMETYLLPQFPHREKLQIVCADAFAYARTQYPKQGFDFAFCDLWHDVSDGLPRYRALKALEALHPAATYTYWIEKTMRCYL